jgi:S1-C subfamily serine protease
VTGPSGDDADPGSAAADRAAGAVGEPAEFARPAGTTGSFAERDRPPIYLPPPPMVSPDEEATFGTPAGAPPFAPLPGERLAPQHVPPQPIHPAIAASFGGGPEAVDGFEPAPGTRIGPTGPAPTSPWWKPDAQHDPWRDPRSSFWLGRAAVFTSGQAAQVDPAEDTEFDEDQPVGPDEPAAAETVSSKRARFGVTTLALTLLVGLVAGLLGGGVGYWLANRSNHLLHRSVSLGKTDTPANRPPGSVAGIAQRVGPAVVSIEVTTADEYAVGSGVVIDPNGYVLTNNHVVAAAASGGSIVVTFADEATAKAQIVGRDPISDLAVLKVPNTKLTVAALGNSDSLAVGDPVIAIGSPLGLQGTVTEGIVSALNRAVHVPAADGGTGTYLNAVQTDAAINPGNSGGALVDAAGAVVGINSAAALGTTNASGQQESISGIGYAIPINYARTIAEQLIKSGKAVHGSLGALGRTAVTTDQSQQGAYLEQITPGGAAAKAGLKAGDVVVAADGKSVLSYDELVVIVQGHKPGDRISVTYFDGSAKKSATVTLGSA